MTRIPSDAWDDEPSPEDRAAAAEILNMGDPGHWLGDHPTEALEDVEAEARYLAGERRRYACDDPIRRLAEAEAEAAGYDDESIDPEVN